MIVGTTRYWLCSISPPLSLHLTTLSILLTAQFKYYNLDYKHLSQILSYCDDWGMFGLCYTYCPYELTYDL